MVLVAYLCGSPNVQLHIEGIGYDANLVLFLLIIAICMSFFKSFDVFSRFYGDEAAVLMPPASCSKP